MKMSEINVQDVLLEVMTEHGLDCAVQEGWVLPNGTLPAIRAYWFPRESSGRLDVQVLIEPNVVVEECFAGVGEGNAALGDALKNFMFNSLHVFLSAFWGKTDEDQVLVESLTLGGTQYVAHIGNVGVRASAGVEVSPPKELLESIISALREESCFPQVGWCRVFFASVNGEPTYEALLNNEVWPRGLEALRPLGWPTSSGFYSFRNFIMCVAA